MLSGLTILLYFFNFSFFCRCVAFSQTESRTRKNGQMTVITRERNNLYPWRHTMFWTLSTQRSLLSRRKIHHCRNERKPSNRLCKIKFWRKHIIMLKRVAVVSNLKFELLKTYFLRFSARRQCEIFTFEVLTTTRAHSTKIFPFSLIWKPLVPFKESDTSCIS